MNVDHTKKSPTLLSICTGYGGIEKGIEKAIGPVSPVAYVEIEAYADASLVAKMETDKLVPVPVFTDLKTFRAHIFRNKVDILTAGYPCQPFSNAGRRRGRKDTRHLWPWIRDAIAAIRPGICFFENVEGHITLGLREVLTDLAELGYRVESSSGEPTWGLFSAAECGAPHQRKRVFIMAYSDNGFCELSGEKILPGGNSIDCGCADVANGECSQRWPHPLRPNIENRNDAGREETADRPGACGEELGHPESHDQRRASVTTMRREGVKAGRSGGHVANPGNSEPNRIPESAGRVKDRAAWHSGVGLANTCQQGPQGCRYARPAWNSCMWPARPGEPQHPWEEPRALADTENPNRRPGKTRIEKGQGERRDRPANESCRGVANSELSIGKINRLNGGVGRKTGKQVPEKRRPHPKAEPKLGRAADGHSCRVDRLRLLGNGVVPATAEKAFTVLMSRIMNPAADRKPIEIQLDLFKAS